MDGGFTFGELAGVALIMFSVLFGIAVLVISVAIFDNRRFFRKRKR